MAQIDSNLTPEQLAQMEREFARKRAQAQRERAREQARLSQVYEIDDEQGCHWAYVEVDGQFVRILGCVSAQTGIEIPDSLNGKPVRELAAESLARLPQAHEIICCEGIESIGAYAFRGCELLERLVLPAQTDQYHPSWIAGCSQLNELVLPGALKAIGPTEMSNIAVHRLIIGKSTAEIAPGAFEKAIINEIKVDADNYYLSTDGIGLYSHDGSAFLALVSSVERYDIASGCTEIAKKAFTSAHQLRQIGQPEGLREIGELAFSHSAITEIVLPHSLRRIGAKAFIGCSDLTHVELNEGLLEIGPSAFASSSITRIEIPSTVTNLGREATSKSKIRYAGDEATFSISPGNTTYQVDRYGGLYRRASDGMHFVELLDPDAGAYALRSGTIAIDDSAVAFHRAIEEVYLPNGLKRIGASAFRVCQNLRSVLIPDSLEEIGKDAFIDTKLETFSIPAGLRELGPNALVMQGAHHEGEPPSLRHIEVDPANRRFYMRDGMLCRRVSGGTSVVVFTSSEPRVAFPEDTVSVEDYAFNNAFGIVELSINARLNTIGACGLSVWSKINRIRIDVAEPIEGRSSFDLRFPDTSRSVHGFLVALGTLGQLYLPDIMAQYDNCLVSSRDYHSPADSANASAYEQVRLIIDRMNDSVLLTDTNRRRYEGVLASNIEEICVDIARHDDRRTIDQLIDLGYLNGSNIESVIQAVGRLQDAAMTAYLLEVKRLRFREDLFDFEL